MISWGEYFKNSLRLVVVLTLLTGVLYPLVVTGVLRGVAPQAVKGTLIMKGDVVQGAYAIGQHFNDPAYFWGRPSSTPIYPYNAMASEGSNLAAGNPKLETLVTERIEALKRLDRENTLPVPGDLITASASGLDPHISPAAASYQLARVARVRGISTQQIRTLIDAHTERRFLGIFGERRVHVLSLNLALDELKVR